jgi:DNA-binding MarR family transcriptional regulator
VTQFYAREMRATGLHATQFTLLQALARNGRVTQGRLGDTLAMDSTTLSRTLRPLEHKGWIRCLPGEDRRERHWEITRGGRAKLRSALPYWERAQQRLRRRLRGEDWAALFEVLGRVAGTARRA